MRPGRLPSVARATAVALAAGALVAAGCSSDEPDADGTIGTTADDPSRTTDTTDAAAPADDDPEVLGPEAVADLTCWEAPAGGGGGVVTLTDATEQFGLVAPLVGMRAHAAAWGDTEGAGRPSLFVGSFADRDEDEYRVRGAQGPSHDKLLQYYGDRFVAGGLPEAFGRTSGAAFADLDADGLDDLVVTRLPRAGPRADAPGAIYANGGNGTFQEVDGTGIDPMLAGRSIGVLDVDADGLLDLFIVDDLYEGASSRLYRNTGGFRFEDVTEDAGLPDDLGGLGLATGDVNRDGVTDMFVGGANRLFVGDGEGFAAAPSDEFDWATFGPEDVTAGAAFGDVDRDGWPDLLVGHHFNSTLDDGREVAVRLYLNRTGEPGATPRFEDVTDRAGLVGLSTKAPDVHLADIDNDGWLDVVTTASSAGGRTPAVFRHSGEADDGVPRFSEPVGLGNGQYWISGPLADVDRDGLLDIFAAEWEPSSPSRLFHNDTDGGHWLSLSLVDRAGGIGTQVRAYEAGGAGDDDRLIAGDEIVASEGYTSGSMRVAHLGLGDATEVDVVITPPHGEPGTVIESVPVDRHLALPTGC